MSVVGGTGTAQRALDAVLAAAGDASVPPGSWLDAAAGLVHLPDRVVAVVLGTPGPDEVGIVEDLLVDRAFADVAGEATALASLADLQVRTVEELRELVGAAALARACGISADAVRDGLRTVRTPT